VGKECKLSYTADKQVKLNGRRGYPFSPVRLTSCTQCTRDRRQSEVEPLLRHHERASLFCGNVARSDLRYRGRLLPAGEVDVVSTTTL